MAGKKPFYSYEILRKVTGDAIKFNVEQIKITTFYGVKHEIR